MLKINGIKEKPKSLNDICPFVLLTSETTNADFVKGDILMITSAAFNTVKVVNFTQQVHIELTGRESLQVYATPYEGVLTLENSYD